MSMNVNPDNTFVLLHMHSMLDRTGVTSSYTANGFYCKRVIRSIIVFQDWEKTIPGHRCQLFHEAMFSKKRKWKQSIFLGYGNRLFSKERIRPLWEYMFT